MFHKQMECKELILRIKGAYHSLEVKQISLDCCPAYLHWRIAQLQYNDRCWFRYCLHFLSFHLTRFFERQDLCWERIDSQSVCKLHGFTPFSAYSFISASIYNKFVHSSLLPLKMSYVFQISSHEIYFSSDEILKTSHEILFLWDEPERSFRIRPFFVGRLILTPRKIH